MKPGENFLHVTTTRLLEKKYCKKQKSPYPISEKNQGAVRWAQVACGETRTWGVSSSHWASSGNRLAHSTCFLICQGHVNTHAYSFVMSFDETCNPWARANQAYTHEPLWHHQPAFSDLCPSPQAYLPESTHTPFLVMGTQLFTNPLSQSTVFYLQIIPPQRQRTEVQQCPNAPLFLLPWV